MKLNTNYPSSSDSESDEQNQDEIYAQGTNQPQPEFAKNFSSFDTPPNPDTKANEFLKNCKINIGNPINIKENNNLGGYKIYEIMIARDVEQTSVFRRYSDFEWLYDTIKILYFGHMVPSLPKKNILAKIDKEGDSFIETRRRQLEKFMRKCLELKVLQSCVEMFEFLNLDNDKFKKYKNSYKLQGDTKLLKSTNWAKIYDKVNDMLKKES